MDILHERDSPTPSPSLGSAVWCDPCHHADQNFIELHLERSTRDSQVMANIITRNQKLAKEVFSAGLEVFKSKTKTHHATGHPVLYFNANGGGIIADSLYDASKPQLFSIPAGKTAYVAEFQKEDGSWVQMLYATSPGESLGVFHF